jgi:acyl dehydratase
MHIDAARVRDYVAATGDDNLLYAEAGVAPALAVAAFALGALLEGVSLPAGSLHASENVTFKAPVPIDAEVECRAVLAQRSVRGGYVVSILESEIVHNGNTALFARATVMSPAPTS